MGIDLRLRERVRTGWGRVRLFWWSVGQSALGGAVAWEISSKVLGHDAPFFAAVAAILSLSLSVLGRLRRVFEIALGVAIGVALGDLLVQQIGHGAWQLGLVVLLSMAVVLLLDGGDLAVAQAALQAVFVVALPPPSGGYVGRWLDALIGGATALAIAFFLPADPRPGMRRAAGEVARTLADAVRGSAAAARARDVTGAAAALDTGRSTQPMIQRWEDTVRAAEEISMLSPLRRHAEAEIAAHRRSLTVMDHAIRNMRVALRRVVAAVEDADAGEESLPPDLLDLMDEFAGALFTLPSALLDPDGEGGRRADAALSTLAGHLVAPRPGSFPMSATVVLAQLRSAVVDLLQIPGIAVDEARLRLA
ncbi:MAG: hypothetical protein QG622_287 [Actinomycetota bacterium]|nr:hypothetical protein [Actinomycetota bacterium]